MVEYIKDYSIWHPRGSQVSSGLRTRIWEVTTTVTRCIKRFSNALTIDTELKDISIYLATDYDAIILEFLELFTSQYEEYIKTSTSPPENPYQCIVFDGFYI